MRVRPYVFPAVAATLVLCGPLLGYAVASRPASHVGTNKSHHVYRLDYAVTVTEPGKAAATSAYTMNVEEGSSGDVRAGANVPLVSSSSPGQAGPRQDVGLSIHCQVTRLGEDLLLNNNTELSGPDDVVGQGPRSIHKITATSDAVASPGKPAVVMSVEEPTSRARYEVTVTATKLR